MASKAASVPSWACALASVVTLARAQHPTSAGRASPAGGVPAGRGCPAEMVRVRDFCIDRWEVSLVDRLTEEPLSPFYPADPRLLRRAFELWQIERCNFGDASARSMPLPDLPRIQRTLRFEPKAVSRDGQIPQGYLSYYTARLACANADKRLCTEEEWVSSCRGAQVTIYPYGAQYTAGKCNVHRALHPAFELHGDSSFGHTDPRLNLLLENGEDPLLRSTGSTSECASRWGDDAVYDMVGNLDEWVEADQGLFLGGFYARGTTKGCEARISSHVKSYYDYSLGTRCCRDADQRMGSS